MADYPISNVPRRVQYVNSGVGPYAFAFEVLTQTDIAVYRGSTKLTLTTDYTVTINANGTGSVTLVTAGTGNITIVGARAIQRSSDYTTGGDLFASTLNTDLDSQTIFSQQLAEDVDLSIKVPVYAPSSTGLTVNPEANGILAWDSTGTNLINLDPTALVNVAVYATAYADVFVSNGIAVAYTISRNPGSLYNLDISVDGVTQEPVRDYTLLGSVVTFTSAMPVNSRIVIKYKEGLPNVSGDSQDIRYVPAGTGAVTTTVQSKLRQTVSVKDFGAVGDGVANDTVAIQAALDSLTTGGQLYFPPGTYLVSGGGLLLQPKSNTTMIGVSGATTLKINSAPSAVSIFGTLNAVSNLIFDGLIFDGNSSVVLGFDTFGLQFPNVGDITVKNCTFKNFVRDGMLLGLTTKVDHLTVDTCNFSNIGFNAVRTYNARMQSVNNSRFFDFITSPLDFNPILIENLETTTIVTNNYFSNDSANWLAGNSTLSLMSDRTYVAGNTIVGGGMIVVHSGPYGRTGIKSYRIIGNSIQDTVSPGIIVNTDVNTDIIVSNNYVRNAFSDGITVLSINVPPYTANTPVIVSNNIIQDTSNATYTNTSQPACIKVAQTSNVIVTGNQCITPRWAGVAILSGANNCTVQGNTIIGQRGQAPTDFLTNVGGGIVVSPGGVAYLEDVFNITINGNFIYNFLTTVSPPSTNVRAGGIVAYNDSSGAKTVKYITIANNVVRDGNGIAIQTYFLENSTVDGNTIWNSNGDIVDTSSTTLLSNAVIGQYTAAPTTGTWKRGTVIYNSTPASAGFVGFVCTASGTPGTWKTFGLIS